MCLILHDSLTPKCIEKPHIAIFMQHSRPALVHSYLVQRQANESNFLPSNNICIDALNVCNNTAKRDVLINLRSQLIMGKFVNLLPDLHLNSLDILRLQGLNYTNRESILQHRLSHPLNPNYILTTCVITIPMSRRARKALL